MSGSIIPAHHGILANAGGAWTPPGSPIGHWYGNNAEVGGEWTDHSGSGNHLTLQGDASITANGLDCDGTGDGGQKTGIVPATGDFTLAGEVNADAAQTDQVFHGNGTSGSRFILYANTTAGSATNDVRLFAGLEVCVGDGDIRGAWHHLIITRSGSTWTVYVDGVQECQGTTSNTIDTDLNIGFREDAPTSTNGIKGNMDNVLFYTSALGLSDRSDLLNDPNLHGSY